MKEVLISEPQPEVRELLCRLVEHAGHAALTELEDADVGSLGALVIEPASERARGLARDVRRLCPDLPVICVSIYPPGAEVAELAPARYVTKPFAIAELMDALRDVIGDQLQAGAAERE